MRVLVEVRNREQRAYARIDHERRRRLEDIELDVSILVRHGILKTILTAFLQGEPPLGARDASNQLDLHAILARSFALA